MLEDNNLTIPNGCINYIVDSEGLEYHIPNWCINDPYYEKILSEVEEESKNITVFYN